MNSILAKEAVDDPVGELSIQVDYMSHPGTGDHKLTVKGLSIKAELQYLFDICPLCDGWIFLCIGQRILTFRKNALKS